MREVTHKIILSILVIFVAIEGVFVYYEIVKTKDFQADILEFEREEKILLTQIGILEDERREHEQEIEQLKRQEEELVVQKEQLNRRVYDLARNGHAIKPLQRSQELIPSKARYIRVIAPNGGEELCLGEQYPIRWEHSGLIEVQILLTGKKVGRSYMEFNYPANLNETGESGTGTYAWEVGRVGSVTVPPGVDYKILILSLDGASSAPQIVEDESDAPFTIVLCE